MTMKQDMVLRLFDSYKYKNIGSNAIHDLLRQAGLVEQHRRKDYFMWLLAIGKLKYNKKTNRYDILKGDK